MTRNEWNLIVDTEFANASEASDFYNYLRRQGCCPLDFSGDTVMRYIQTWKKSKMKGRNTQIINRKRRQTFGPGKYWAASSAGVALNKKYVKGWRGINPENP